MRISFVGHSFIPLHEKVKTVLKDQIRQHIRNGECVTCYLGGYGDFDEICARACKELKKERGGLELVYVTPYPCLTEQEGNAKLGKGGTYDAVIYPPIENTPPKFAISKRNEWMMANADLVFAYVKHNYGGAFRALLAAKRRKKKIVNICDFI